MPLKGFVPYREEDAEKYNRLRWWAGLTFGDLLDKAADTYPDKEALVDREERFTFSQIRERVNCLGISLMELEIEPLDRAMVQLPNWHEFIIAYFALQKIGAIPILLVPRYREYEINHIARLTEARVWILPGKHRGMDYRPIVRSVLGENAGIGHVLFARAEAPECGLSLGALIEDGSPTGKNLEQLALRRPDPMEVAHMGPTGGTTGLPKIVPRTHNDYLSRAEYVARARELTVDDTLLVVAPVTHDLAFSIGFCATLFSMGKTVMLDDTDPESICRTIEGERVTNVAWTPTLAYRVLHYDRRRDFDLSSLSKMYCGGGMCPPDLIRSVSEEMGCNVSNGYGGTEGMSTLPQQDYDVERKCRTVGRPTCPYDTYKIVDHEGREVPRNVPGELVVKGPGIFTGYYRMSEENERVFDRDGFFRTGDQAMIDDSGDIVLTGRIKNIIVRGGENISPFEIENLIMTHPEVAAVAVVGMPDPLMGERACAYIQPCPGKKVDLPGITSFLKGKGASVLQCPERVELVVSIPVTGAKGLVDRKALVEDIKRKLGIGNNGIVE